MDSHILEIKETLSGECRQFHCAAVDRGEGWLVVRYMVPDAFVLDGVKIPKGALSFGYFWEDRPYNAYHFVEPTGTTLALYCNISESTCIREDVIHWRDLVVDVLILPDGRTRVLDVSELPASLPKAMVDSIFDTSNILITTGHNLLTELKTKTADYL